MLLARAAGLLLCLITCACTDGHVAPFSFVQAAAGGGVGGDGGDGGRGTAGRPPRAGRGGSNSQPRPQICIPQWPGNAEWPPERERDEDELYDRINFAIGQHAECAGEALRRDGQDMYEEQLDLDEEPLDLDEELRCWARLFAHTQETWSTTMEPPPDVPAFPPSLLPAFFVLPPGGSGGGRRPPSMVEVAYRKVMNNPDLCERLNAPYIRAMGIGHEGNTWVFTFGPN
jgi:hypothetical protein